MERVRHPSRQATGGDRRTWRVVDDFPSEVPVGPAELDAVEAFLMPLVNAILSGETCSQEFFKGPASATPSDSQVPQKSGKLAR